MTAAAFQSATIICISAWLCCFSSPLSAQGRSDSELAPAVQFIDRGEYTMAITRLGALIEKWPNSTSAIDALFHMGRAYEGIGAPQEAIENYTEYLVRAPGGVNEADAIRGLGRAHAANEAAFPTSEGARTQLENLKSAFEREPSVSNGMVLAAMYWRLEQYEAAGKIFKQLHETDPSIASDPEFSSRVEIRKNGQLLLLTPEEQLRRSLTTHPLAVINANAYRGGRDRFTQKARWYIVAGEVINRSDRTVYGVEVHTTIYAFGNQIRGAETKFIGKLDAGASRAFSARFTDFEDINAVVRFDCKTTLQEGGR